MREMKVEQSTIWKVIGFCSEGKGSMKQPSSDLVGH